MNRHPGPRVALVGDGQGRPLSSVQRFWQAYQLRPHRVCSSNRRFAETVTGIAGGYLEPGPRSTNQPDPDLNRTQPGVPLKPGRCGTTAHDYKCDGTTTLFAAPNMLEGTLVGP